MNNPIIYNRLWIEDMLASMQQERERIGVIKDILLQLPLNTELVRCQVEQLEESLYGTTKALQKFLEDMEHLNVETITAYEEAELRARNVFY